MSESLPEAAKGLTLDRFRWVGGHADVWAVFRDARSLAAVVTALAAPLRGEQVDAVCGVESRGFLLGAAVAVELGAGFLPVRKGTGMFPGEKTFGQTAPDYRGLRHTLRLQRGAVGPGDRVLLVDDWVQTGAQALTVKALIEERGAVWLGCSVLVDQLSAQTRAQIGPVHTVLAADELPPDAGETGYGDFSEYDKYTEYDKPAETDAFAETGEPEPRGVDA